MRRLLTFVLVSLLMTAACSDGASAPEAAEAAAQVIARVNAATVNPTPVDPGEAVVPEGCRLVVETDEYGFETEIVLCDEEPEEPPASTTAPAGTGDTADTADTADTESTTTSTIAPADPLSLEEWIGSADARGTARWLRRLAIGQTGCESPADLVTLENLALSAPPEIREPLVAAATDLRRGSELCNDDVRGWQEALESALDHLEDLTAILEEARGV
jgi:hypothetical protein